MRLIAHQLGNPLELVPAGSSREWMDKTSRRHAYKCLPLSIANGSGWELLSPCSFAVSWNGGPNLADLEVEILDGYTGNPYLAKSHFGTGIVTISTGYIFRTEPGWGVWTRGTPNCPKDGISPLEGLIETDWLPYSFTMNWMMTRPGRVVFEKGEPLCFLTLLPHYLLDHISPELTSIESNPLLKEECDTWALKRGAYTKTVQENFQESRKQGWTGHYMRGETPSGYVSLSSHLTKRRLKKPLRVENPAPLTVSPIPLPDLTLLSPNLVPDVAQALKSCPMHGLTQKEMQKS